MARRIPTVRNCLLLEHTEKGSFIDAIAVGSAGWYGWLEHHCSFRFDHPACSFTARKEQRAGGWYWYAYRRQTGRLRTAYLGRSPELSVTRLGVIAAALAGGAATRDGQASAGDQVPALHASLFQEAGAGLFPRHNLPQQLTSLVGREQEAAAAKALLQRPEVRLVSMVGPPGVGKTRLGLQVATDLLESFADGVFFVALAPLRDADLVLSAVAQALGLRVMGDQSCLDVLKMCLRAKRCLVVLDNFEQVVSVAPLLANLLEACPALKILVTSREVLHLRAEHQFWVPPLALPDCKRLPDEKALASIAAVDLFVQRAQAASPDFELTQGNAGAIAEVCIRLDGLPLAIELAAARVRLLAPQPLLVRLDRRLQILTAGARDLPERQRTLRNTLAWSYELLTAQEQRLFQRMSVFVGGATLEAVEAVCEALGDERGQVVEGVASLIDKSLVHQQAQRDEEHRLQMLETLQEYGLECLEKSGEAEATHRAHAAYYLRLAEAAEPHVFGTEQVHWLDWLEQEDENLRAALNWCLECEEREMAMRLAGALGPFWWLHGHLREGRTVLMRALAPAEGIPASIRAKALTSVGLLANLLGDQSQAEACCEESLALLLLTESLELYKEVGDKRSMAQALAVLGHVVVSQGEYAQGQVLLKESLEYAAKVGDGVTPMFGCIGQAMAVFGQGDYPLARELFEECLRIFSQRDYDPKLYTVSCLMGLGTVLSALGEPAEAARLWGAAEMLWADMAQSPVLPLVRTSYEQYVTSARAQLGPEAFAAAWGEGRTMTAAQALASLEPATFPGPPSAPSLPAAPSTLTPQAPTSPDGLTAREMDVLRLLAQGLTSALIAEQLIIGLVTVNFHVRSLYGKLGVSSRAAATRYALEHHLL